jgi:hypothetical protein
MGCQSSSSSDEPQDLEDLAGVGAEIYVHTLETNRATPIHDHETHLSHTAHHAHWLIRFGQHVVRPRNLQIWVEENRQRDTRPALQLSRALGRVAVDGEDISRAAQLVGRSLQLNELLHTQFSRHAHVEDEYRSDSSTRADWEAHPFGIRQRERGRGSADQSVSTAIETADPPSGPGNVTAVVLTGVLAS